MKRIAIWLVICLMILQLPVSALATNTCGENITWEFDAATGTLTISGQGEMVTGEHAFWGGNNKQVKCVVIEEGVTSISYGAFTYCPELETVRLPGSLKSINGNAFNKCSKLTTINLEHVTAIGNSAFDGCGLTEVTIPAGVSVLSSGVFSNCRQLKNIIWHNDVTRIGDYAFNNCSQITSVHLPEQVQTVGQSAFNGCSGLTDLRLNEGLQMIGNQAFAWCDSLVSVTVPDTVREICGYAFAHCGVLSDFTLGAGVSKIAVNAFRNSINLTAFQLSDQNAAYSLDRGVLYSADKTRLVMMPPGFSGKYEVLPGVISIANNACQNTGLTEVTLPDSVVTIEKYAFDDCLDLRSVVLGEGLQTMAQCAFAGTPITELTIPASVTEIGTLVFSKCKQLTKVVFMGPPPKIDKVAFSDVTATMYRPGHIAEWDEGENLYGGKPDWVSYCTGIHVPVAEVIKTATCTDTGLIGETRCGICDAFIEGQKILQATGHSFGEWTEDVLPTTEKEGAAKRTCTDCGTAEWKTLEKLPMESEQKPAPTEPISPTPTEPISPTPNLPDEPDGSNVSDEPSQPAPSDTAEAEGANQMAESESGRNRSGAAAKWIAVAAVSLFVGLGTAHLISGHKRKP